MYAYDENLIHKAMDSLGWMFEYGVNDYKLSLEQFYTYFLTSGYADRFSKGESRIVSGMSGTELAMEVIYKMDPFSKLPAPSFCLNRSAEYWLGWSLAYYQWYRNICFKNITAATSINSILLMYKKYHEMDISHFVEKLDADQENYKKSSTLKRLRLYAGLSQKELSVASEIPLRTIQQYEQGQKDIRKANVDYIVRLSKSLYCTVEDIII